MRMLSIATAAVLIACGQPATVGGEAEAQANGQAAYVAACTQAMVRQNPQARQWAPQQCEEQWQTVVAAGPMADAILAAGVPTDVATLRTRLTAVRWSARPEGTLLASGRLGRNVAAQVDREGPTLYFRWGETGAMIPFDVIGALNERGAQTQMIGCSSYGGGESNKAYRVTVQGRAPFMITVYDRMAPTANAESFYAVGLNLTGRVQTLAQLRSDGMEWAARCP
jgi:hypothetical protein